MKFLKAATASFGLSAAGAADFPDEDETLEIMLPDRGFGVSHSSRLGAGPAPGGGCARQKQKATYRCYRSAKCTLQASYTPGASMPMERPGGGCWTPRL